MLLLEIPLVKLTKLHQYSEEQLKCTVMAEQRKTKKYSAMAESQNAKFIPFAVEMDGGLGKSAKKLLNKISKVC